MNPFTPQEPENHKRPSGPDNSAEDFEHLSHSSEARNETTATFEDWNAAMTRTNHFLQFGMPEEALIAAQDAVRYAEKVFYRNDTRIPMTYDNLALAAQFADKPEIACSAFGSSIALRRQSSYVDLDLVRITEMKAQLDTMLGRPSEGVEGFRAALAMRENLSNSSKFEEIVTSFSLSNALKQSGDQPAANRQFVEAYSQVQIMPHQQRLPLLGALIQISDLFMDSGSYSEAEFLIKDALAIARYFQVEDPSLTLALKQKLSGALYQQGKYDAGIATLNEIRDLLKEHASETTPMAIQARETISQLYTEKGEIVKGERALREVVRDLEKNFDPANPLQRQQLADSLLELAHNCLASAKRVEAREFAKRAGELIGSDEGATRASYEEMMAELEGSKGKFESAEERLNLAIELRGKLKGNRDQGFMSMPQDIPLGQTHLHLADLHTHAGRYDDAEEAIESARLNFDKAGRMGGQGQAHILQAEGRLAAERGDRELAEEKLLESLKVMRAAVAPRKPMQLASVMMDLGALHCESMRYEDAKEYFAEARSIIKERGREATPINVAILMKQSEIAEFEGDSELAEALQREAQANIYEIKFLNEEEEHDRDPDEGDEGLEGEEWKS
jgi:tetratricopeptide (TPR) repeat protein